MNLTIESLNLWGARAREFAWPVVWQSSLLIGLLFTLDFALRRRVRAAVRYALWLVVLLKLVLPPALALPTGLGWWLRPAQPAPKAPPAITYTVTYGPSVAPPMPEPALTLPVASAPAPPALTLAAWALLLSSAVSLGLLGWMLRRWRQVARDVRQAGAAPQSLQELLDEARHSVGLRRAVRLGLMEQPMSPAVCGLFRPRILLPRSLAEQLPPAQLRAILVHELIHLRRGDVWVNCAQALLQLLYWWHPLLWLANARIRQVREEAVDDAVMAALGEHAEAYAPTLLEVARLALRRPLTSLGLVGILESRSSLRQRIQRLLEFHPPRRAGLTLASALLVLGFAAVALPMGQAPGPVSTTPASLAMGSTNSASGAPATNTVPVEQRNAARRLVHDGMLLFQRGMLAEAKTDLQQALALDPRNQGAWYYSNLVAAAENHSALRGSPVAGATGRQLIYKKLNSIRLDDAFLQVSTLGEAVRLLTAQAKENDPDKAGINFIIASNWPSSGEGASATNSPGMATADLASVRLTLKPFFTQTKLEDVLNEVVKSAERPLKYSVEDYGVVFSTRQDRELPPLATRTFRVDAKVLLAGLSGARGQSTNATPQTVSEELRNVFTTLGIELEPPKSMFYKDRAGMLYVRATPADVDTIEQVLHTLMVAAPPQIHIACKFVEIAQDDRKALSADWYLGNFVVNNGSNNVPGNMLSPASSQGLSSGLRSGLAPAGSPALPLNGVLTDPQYRVVLHALDQREGAEVLAAPQVVTISGRQAQCKAVHALTIVKGIKAQALTAPGVPKGEQDSLFEMEPMECGPVLDIVPTLLADGYTVKLSVTAGVVEFLGYAHATNHVTVYVGGKRKQVLPPLPMVREAKASCELNARDGQTVVLATMMSERVIALKDSVPVLGSLPLVGGLFRSESRTTQKRNLMVFITPTLIDPAGNRIHSDEQLPSARNSIPVQPKR